MFDFLKERSTLEEIMDDFTCSGEVVHQTLRELHVINTYLGGNQLSVNALRRLVKPLEKNKFSLVDLGCGGGDMLKSFDRWGQRHGVDFELTGIDANAHIIEYAQTNSQNHPAIHYQAIDILSPAFQQQSFDIIHCSLFLHHFTGHQVVTLFRQLQQQARVGIIINDLHRHWLSYYFTKYVIVGWSKSKMVKFDSVVSVARAFTKEELEGYLRQAGIEKFQLRWRWAFRWELVIRC